MSDQESEMFYLMTAMVHWFCVFWSFSKYSQLWLLWVSFDVWSLELLVSFLHFCNHSNESVPGLHWSVSNNSGPRKEQC